MASIDLDQFRGAHRPPTCAVFEKTIPLNSSEIDPASGDYRPAFVEVPYCETHDVYVSPLSLGPVNLQTQNP